VAGLEMTLDMFISHSNRLKFKNLKVLKCTKFVKILNFTKPLKFVKLNLIISYQNALIPNNFISTTSILVSLKQ
jgi:hypothetical protein